MASKKATSRGRFIVVEGLDGAGTTTQTAARARARRAAGHTVLTTNAPSTGPIGTLIRQGLSKRLRLASGAPMTAETLALLFAADRVDHLANEVVPALEAGTHVISDRYLLSSLAYQGVEVGLPWVSSINHHALTPDLTLFLSIDVKAATRRRVVRGGRPDLYENNAMQKKTAQQYARAIALRRDAGEHIINIDGSAPIEEVTARLISELKAVGLKLGAR